MLWEFSEKFDTYRSRIPNVTDVPADVWELRQKLIDEEYQELKDAVEAEDIIEIADACADLLYVVYGTALAFGIPITKVFEEVHRSNMSKVLPDGTVGRRADGKILKSPTYSPPNLEPILREHTAVAWRRVFGGGKTQTALALEGLFYGE